jgi:hypothetical protein
VVLATRAFFFARPYKKEKEKKKSNVMDILISRLMAGSNIDFDELDCIAHPGPGH